MRQNITLSLEKTLLKKAKVLAAKRKVSLSRLLAEELTEQVDKTRQYETLRRQALALLKQGFHLGGRGLGSRDELHDRTRFR